jgi:hypothetical protein
MSAATNIKVDELVKISDQLKRAAESFNDSISKFVLR